MVYFFARRVANGARVIGATDDDDDVGFAGSGRRRWCRHGATYGVIDGDRKFRSTDGSLTGVCSL